MMLSTMEDDQQPYQQVAAAQLLKAFKHSEGAQDMYMEIPSLRRGENFE
uniref:Uncharacterized protein n=1 Tax=Arundo donax TaxID=35708 RepID=A0A0A9B3D7_ARUDO